jgi:hypothetical protein
LRTTVLILRAGEEVVGNPRVALAVDHELAAPAIAATGELERKDKGAWTERQVRSVRWASDLKAAKAAGMAIEIPLKAKDRKRGFSRIIASRFACSRA